MNIPPPNNNAGARAEIVEIIRTERQTRLLRTMFAFANENPTKWWYWEEIRDGVYTKTSTIKIAQINSLCKQVAAELEQRETSQNNGAWKFLLLRKTIERSLHWKLQIEERKPKGAPSAQPECVEEPAKPRFTWGVANFESRLPAWIPYLSTKPLNIAINPHAHWQAPPDFKHYEAWKLKRWRKKRNEDKDDTAILSFGDIREQVSLEQDASSIEIGAKIARYSDFVATNEQIIEWYSAEGDTKRVIEFKERLGSVSPGMHFPPHAANPITVLVNILTSDKKIVLTKERRATPWNSPAAGLIDPHLDRQRTSPFPVAINETAIRTAYRNLGLCLHQELIQWRAIVLHLATGIATIVGEVELKLDMEKVKSVFRDLKRPAFNIPPLFIDFEPVAILNFIKKEEPLQILEIALAISLSRKCDAVKIAT